jgi:hypothetical protein
VGPSGPYLPTLLNSRRGVVDVFGRLGKSPLKNPPKPLRVEAGLVVRPCLTLDRPSLSGVVGRLVLLVAVDVRRLL